MAGPFTHLIFAKQIAANYPHTIDWKRHFGSFALGAIAMDSGYMQTKDSFAADLAHTVGSLQLARTLLHRADNPSDHAFALGWISHAILDRHSHPIINAHAGNLSGTDHPISYADNAPLHAAVELGIDACWIDQLPTVPYRDLQQQIPSASPLLSAAYANTYGIEFPPTLFASNLNRIVNALRLLHGLYRWNRIHPFRSTPRTQSRWRSIAFPMQPDRSFEDAMRDGIKASHHDFSSGIDRHFVDLPDINLDTGKLGFCDPTYPPAVSTLDRLNTIRFHAGLPPLQQ